MVNLMARQSIKFRPFRGRGPKLNLHIDHISSPLRATFAISRGAKTSAETVRVTLEGNGILARGECVPYARYGETVESVMAEIEEIRAELVADLTRKDLQQLLPAGAARCAVDCALWDLEAKQTGIPVWQLAGLPQPVPIETAETVSMDTPEKMAADACKVAGRLLKLKLGSADDLDRVRAVHEARPDARLILDANEGMDPAAFSGIAQEAASLGTVLIEQPFPASDDAALLKTISPVAICADESAHTSADIEELSKRYDVVNVKLDKTGGLTEGLKMVRAAQDAGMGVMIGCMVAGSISMAPAVLLGQLADFVDLDGALLLAKDIEKGLAYKDGFVAPPLRDLWG